jgi:triosephosphate isomerase
MRKKMVVANWKMHCLRAEAQSLFDTIKKGVQAYTGMTTVILPSFLHLHLAERMLVDSLIDWGAQNLYLGEAGAYTGEVSGVMLADYGCQYVLVGHSERRLVFHEDLILVAEKFKSAVKFGLQPILCVGETLQEREYSKMEAVIAEQLESILQAVGIDVFNRAVIAYEPIWAIGTGLTATPEQAQDAHLFIRSQLARYSIDVANAARILYGGSVKADNAAELFAMPDIDGSLVGGASLNAKSFLAICAAAA